MRRCDNGEKAYLGSPIESPACFRAEATRQVTISYNDVESDTLYLCDECVRVIRRSARRHGYRVKAKALP